MPDQALSLDSLIGLEFSHYRILKKIGSGGMGVVYLARDSHLDRDVALKLLHPGTISDETVRHRFHNEALALSKLNHPNIATIHDFDTQGGTDFLVMEYIPGSPLSTRLAAGPLPESEVLALALQLVEGLIAAHEHSIIHRDLKPANLLITNDGRLKILDFGLAKLRLPLTESVTQSQLESRSIAGTFPYMAPEQLLGGDLDGRTDLYATGLILYEMATGQRPFAELPSGKLLDAILHRPPIPPRQFNSKLSFELEHIISKCLEKNPADRYQSAEELAVDLRRLQRDSSADTVPFSPLAPAPPPSFLRNKSFLALSLPFSSSLLLLPFSSFSATRGLRPTFISGSPRSSIHCCSSSRQPFRRSRSRILCRRHYRRTHHAARQKHQSPCHLPPVRNAVQAHFAPRERNRSQTRR